jgi:hypothetical protein
MAYSKNPFVVPLMWCDKRVFYLGKPSMKDANGLSAQLIRASRLLFFREQRTLNQYAK